MVCTRDAGSAFAWTRRYVARVLLAFVAASSVDAQSAPATNDPPRDTPRWRASHCLSGVTYGAPQKLAASYAGGFVREGVGDKASDYCAFVAIKLGFGGVRGAVGFAQAKGPLGSGAALSGNVLRTFSSPTGATAKRQDNRRRP